MSIDKHDWMQAWVNLIHAGTFLKQGLDQALREKLGFGLSEQDLIKQLYVNSGRLSLTELGQRIYFSKSGITRMLDRLEKAGLVQRLAVEGDRRSLTAALTEQGEQAFLESRKVLDRYVRTAFRELLSDNDINRLKTVLQKLLEAHDVWDGQQRHLKGGPGA